LKPIENIDLTQAPFAPRAGTIKNLDLEQKPFKIPSPKDYQEVVTEMVARKILEVFGIATVGSLLVGAVLLLLAIRFCYTPQDTEALVEKAMVPFLRGVGSFASTVFGPLLAFILGFYFGKGGTGRK